jgi:hypothetical protein
MIWSRQSIHSSYALSFRNLDDPATETGRFYVGFVINMKFEVQLCIHPPRRAAVFSTVTKLLLSIRSTVLSGIKDSVMVGQLE